MRRQWWFRRRPKKAESAAKNNFCAPRTPRAITYSTFTKLEALSTDDIRRKVKQDRSVLANLAAGVGSPFPLRTGRYGGAGPLTKPACTKWGGVMSDGREEREERGVRIEQEKRENREDRIDRDDEDESEPERVDS